MGWKVRQTEKLNSFFRFTALRYLICFFFFLCVTDSSCDVLEKVEYLLKLQCGLLAVLSVVSIISVFVATYSLCCLPWSVSILFRYRMIKLHGH